MIKKGMTFWISCLILMTMVFSNGYGASNLTIKPVKDPIKDITLFIDPPTGIKVGSPINGIVKVTWKDNTTIEEGYMIERKQGNNAFMNVGFVGANITEFQDSELTTYPIYPGEVYTYRVRAFKDDFYSDYTETKTVTVKKNAPPTAASMLNAELLTSSSIKPIRLSWNNNAIDQVKIQVQRSKDEFSFEVIAELEPDETMYDDESDIELDVSYTYRVEVFNHYGSAYSNYDTVIKPSERPSAPKDFRGIGIDSTTIELTWTDTSNNEDGFLVKRKDNGTYTGTYTPTFNLAADSTSLTDYSLQPETKYSYILMSFNELSRSPYLEVHVHTGPKAPINVTAVKNALDQVVLEWDNDSNIATDLSISRKEGNGPFKQITSLQDMTMDIYVDTNVELGKTYTYYMNTYNVFTPSSNSEEVKIELPASSSQTILLKVNEPKTIHLKLGSTTYKVGQQVMEMDITPVNQEGRLLVPVRYITEALGATASWEPATQKITIELDQRILELWIGQNQATVNGQSVQIDSDHPEVTPVIVPPGRTMVPLRFITESLGCTVGWDAVTQEAIITYE